MLNSGQQIDNGVSADIPLEGTIKPACGLDDLTIPLSHEERLEWVRKSCERFFEKIREFESLVTVF